MRKKSNLKTLAIRIDKNLYSDIENLKREEDQNNPENKPISLAEIARRLLTKGMENKIDNS